MIFLMCLDAFLLFFSQVSQNYEELGYETKCLEFDAYH